MLEKVRWGESMEQSCGRSKNVQVNLDIPYLGYIRKKLLTSIAKVI